MTTFASLLNLAAPRRSGAGAKAGSRDCCLQRFTCLGAVSPVCGADLVYRHWHDSRSPYCAVTTCSQLLETEAITPLLKWEETSSARNGTSTLLT